MLLPVGVGMDVVLRWQRPWEAEAELPPGTWDRAGRQELQAVQHPILVQCQLLQQLLPGGVDDDLRSL